MAVLFPIYFGSVCAAAGADNLVLWSYGTSVATFITAVLAPILGSLADHKGHKKRLFVACLVLGVAFTLFSALTDDYRGLLVGYVISHIGFSGSCLFYDAFLTDVTTRERMDRVSAWGYAMGYIGGSTIPFILAIIILFVMGMENPVAFKLVILLTSVWWLVFSIPFLKNVHQVHYVEAKRGLLRSTFRNLWATAKDIFTHKRVFLFIIAYFFYIDGVNTIISVSTSYGTTLGLDTVGMILALLVTQVVAMPFSILFGKLAGKVGSINLLCGAVGIYFVITVVGPVPGTVLVHGLFGGHRAGGHPGIKPQLLWKAGPRGPLQRVLRLLRHLRQVRRGDRPPAGGAVHPVHRPGLHWGYQPGHPVPHRRGHSAGRQKAAVRRGEAGIKNETGKKKAARKGGFGLLKELLWGKAAAETGPVAPVC